MKQDSTIAEAIHETLLQNARQCSLVGLNKTAVGHSLLMVSGAAARAQILLKADEGLTDAAIMAAHA